MPPVGLEPTISADKRPQMYALDRAHWDRHLNSSVVTEKTCIRDRFYYLRKVFLNRMREEADPKYVIGKIINYTETWLRIQHVKYIWRQEQFLDMTEICRIFIP
jgi:hypothetical protein